MTPAERRKEMLNRVESYVCKDRMNTYGDAEDNFRNIADIANIVLGRKLKKPLDRLDVALFSSCIKLARFAESPHHLDNLLDLAGYAVCGAGIVDGDSPHIEAPPDVMEPFSADPWDTGLGVESMSDEWAKVATRALDSPPTVESRSFIHDGVPYINRVVYVLGPFSNGSSATPDQKAENVAHAMDAGVALARRGWLPHVPHAATAFLEDVTPMTYDDFMELDEILLNTCGAGFRFRGDSVGADREAFVLKKLGRPMWNKLEDVPDLREWMRL